MNMEENYNKCIKLVKEYEDNLDMMKDIEIENKLIMAQLDKMCNKMTVEEFTRFAQKTGYFDLGTKFLIKEEMQ